VVPPIPLGPQVRHVDAPSVYDPNRRSIEFTVLPDGTVSDVRLRNRSFSMQEAMLLSAVKAWRFLPATKDGKPVAYRKVILLTDYN
jgi:TonB family protein